MYIPLAFQENRLEALHDLIRRYSFGILVSGSSTGEPVANHFPLLLDAERGPFGTLVGHMARANPQWESFREGAEVLVIFPGPHAYVSPSWYEARLSVPTWNYVAVHAYGTPRLVENETALYQILETTVQTYEAPFDPPWRLDLPDGFVARMMKGIVGFEIEITRIEGKLKLSQNRSMADQQRIAATLEQQDDPQAVEVAALMRRLARPAPSVPAGAGTPTESV